jgi:hypothetical protein
MASASVATTAAAVPGWRRAARKAGAPKRHRREGAAAQVKSREPAHTAAASGERDQ